MSSMLIEALSPGREIHFIGAIGRTIGNGRVRIIKGDGKMLPAGRVIDCTGSTVRIASGFYIINQSEK